jgi:hypothetical protein
MSRRCSANPPCAAIPGTVWELCGKASVNSVTLCRPLLYGLHDAPLERGRRNPQKRYGRQPCTRAGRCRDVGPVERVSSITFGPVQPSPPMYHHLGHCSTIPSVVGTRDDETSPRSLPVHPTVFRQLSPRVSVRTATEREAPILLPSKPLLYGYRTRHDAQREQDSSGQTSTPRHCVPCRHM